MFLCRRFMQSHNVWFLVRKKRASIALCSSVYLLKYYFLGSPPALHILDGFQESTSSHLKCCAVHAHQSTLCCSLSWPLVLYEMRLRITGFFRCNGYSLPRGGLGFAVLRVKHKKQKVFCF